MNDEILVAGGTGLVGANLSSRLKEIGRKVVSTRYSNNNAIFSEYRQYDFKNFEDCMESTKNKNVVIICAGEFHGVKKDKSFDKFLLNNLKINIGLIEACVENDVKTVVILSTSAVYQNAFHEIREDELDMNMPPYKSYFGVGWTFRYIEQISKYYSRNTGIRIVLLRPTNIYGPHDNFEDNKSHVIPALIKRAFNDENPIVAWGNPNVVRDFIFVEDVVDDIIEVIDNPNIPSCDPINICNGIPLTIREAAEIILEQCSPDKRIEFDKDKPTSIPYRALSNQKYKVYFGNRMRTLFSDGIRRTIDWYLKNK